MTTNENSACGSGTVAGPHAMEPKPLQPSRTATGLLKAQDEAAGTLLTSQSAVETAPFERRRRSDGPAGGPGRGVQDLDLCAVVEPHMRHAGLPALVGQALPRSVSMSFSDACGAAV